VGVRQPDQRGAVPGGPGGLGHGVQVVAAVTVQRHQPRLGASEQAGGPVDAVTGVGQHRHGAVAEHGGGEQVAQLVAAVGQHQRLGGDAERGGEVLLEGSGGGVAVRAHAGRRSRGPHHWGRPEGRLVGGQFAVQPGQAGWRSARMVAGHAAEPGMQPGLEAGAERAHRQPGGGG